MYTVKFYINVIIISSIIRLSDGVGKLDLKYYSL